MKNCSHFSSMSVLSIHSSFIFIFFIGCNTQSKPNTTSSSVTDKIQTVGGGCEGCELMYTGMPENITTEHTSGGWETGRQKLILMGKVLAPDGKTPAKDVIVYYWHTNDKGLYAPSNKTTENTTLHGELRGWIKTDSSGNYSIKTSRPAAYPNDIIPQHIHLSIKEKDISNEYFADLYFTDDPLYANHQKKYGKVDRAGNEVLSTVLINKTQIAKHNIILGLNIPNYPNRKD